MTDDFSEVVSGGCNVFTSPSNMYNYSRNIRRTYTNIGGKWIYTAEQTYSSLPNNYVCVDISGISSNSEWYPLYGFIAFSLVVFLIFMFWAVIKRLLLWRI